uniref:N-acyl-D-amino-acid deacylase family protein n=1 Tax=Nocardioides sp. R-C-SC26 TaxID=2870414 RepID=UPI001E47C6FE
MTRWLIRGARVLDGTGAPERPADLVVVDGRVDAVLDRGPGEGPARDAHPPPAGFDSLRVLDAEGLMVCPGFIDVHSHADASALLAQPDTSKILQGVTTEVVGNCGVSLAPLGAASAAGSTSEVAQRLSAGGVESDWHDVDAYFARLDRGTQITNTMHLIGHGAIREAIVGSEARAASADELRAMQSLLDDACAAGAVGLSSGLIYPPGVYAGPEELRALATVLDHSRVYATHVRNESDLMLEAVAEAIHTVAGARCGLQLSHLKATGRRNWGATATALKRLDHARDGGARVHQDVYPYTAASTALAACLPPWVHAGGTVAALARLDTPADRDRIRRELDAPGPHAWDNPVAAAGWSGIVVAATDSGADEGLSLSALAERDGVDPFDALVGVLLRERGRAVMVEHSMCEEDVVGVLAHPATIVASDGLPPTLGSRPHPRLHGTFPRVLARYVRERGVLDWPEAVHRMTGLPAAAFGVPDRGVVRPGAVADLVAFDPLAVAGPAAYAH